MEKKWEVFPSKSKNIKEQILLNRNLKTKNEQEKFLHPHFNLLTESEKLFPDLKKVLLRLKKAIKEKELIYVYGDYDVDGLTAAAILWETIDFLGGKVLPYIPSRQLEGYGLHSEALELLASQGAKVVISVDCGITAIEQAKFAKKLGIDLIITDHHQTQEVLPQAFAILHTTSLSGSGVAFKLATELLEEFGKTGSEQFSRNLELATLGTVADMVPLVGENRIIVKNGLFSLSSTNRTGLKEIYKEAGVGKNIGTYEIGHIIAPRLNAMGRLESALDSLRLLLTRKEERARKLARLLSETNKQRQQATAQALEHARQTVEKDFKNEKFFVVSSGDYLEGIVGLVAGRLTEEFYRPSAVISEMEVVSKGSARSIRGFNITEAIHKNSNLLLSHGGHPMAAGFSIEKEQIPYFREAMLKSAEELLTQENLQPIIKIDMEIDFNEISNDLIEIIKDFEPFGISNPEPVFLTKKVSVLDQRTVGKDGKHLGLSLEQNGKTFDAIAFGFGNKKPRENEEIDIVFNLRENVWNSRKKIEMRIVDFRKS